MRVRRFSLPAKSSLPSQSAHRKSYDAFWDMIAFWDMSSGRTGLDGLRRERGFDGGWEQLNDVAFES